MPHTNRNGAALVTGAAKRIGRAIALGLAARGFSLALHCRQSVIEAEELAHLIEAQGGCAAVVTADLADPAALAALVPEAARRVGPLSVLINSASEFRFDDIASLAINDWDRIMSINLRAPVFLAKSFAEQVADDADDPCIVNIVDQRVLRTQPDYLTYGLSKSALHAATPILAQALAPRIRVNAIGPGPTMRNQFQSEADFSAEESATLLGRGSSPDSVVDAINYLIGAKSATGQTIIVDGGQHLTFR